MSLFTIVIGSLLLALGIVGYVATGQAHPTALIPAYFGLAYMLLGYIALRRPSWRKHVMHVAAVLSLIGIAANVTAIASIAEMLSGHQVARPAAVVSRSLMALFCAVHLLASLRSFLNARLRPSST